MKNIEVYPYNFEDKIGFSSLKEDLLECCSSDLGRSLLGDIKPTADFKRLQCLLDEVGEMLRILSGEHILPSLHLEDSRLALLRIRPDQTYLEEDELLSLRQMISALHALARFFLEQNTTGGAEHESFHYLYPRLSALYLDAPLFPKIEQNLDQLLDQEGKIKDNATQKLLSIRRELQSTERSLSGMLARIMRQARNEGWIDQDVQASIRDGRLVIPVQPQYKRKIKGIVYDESATGKTVFIEPIELVEANNRIRELESEERKELIRILIDIANKLRPNIPHFLKAYDLIAYTDVVLAKARWAKMYQAFCPILVNQAHIEWYGAKHPLLMRSLANQGRSIVPLNISLKDPEERLLVISGPNAGGKSVCLKTVGLLQYSLQCGFPVPMMEHSSMGIFTKFFLDIGDEQSIEDDLSTYSSHLRNMKHFERYADAQTLMLIDEFGGGTEPHIGGAIAEALLTRFNDRKAYGVITTHYQNLKTLAEDTLGLVNGAMLYDRHQMSPLFTLSIGRPGSSFAVEIARKIGLPDDIIQRASDIVGNTYVSMDKYLQDIIRDKRYWETKRLNIRKEEKKLQEAAERYSIEAEENQRLRQEIITQAKREAQRIVQDANRRIELAIKEIREAEAHRERTISIRQGLKTFQEELKAEEIVNTQAQEKAKREVEKLLRRRERRAERIHKQDNDDRIEHNVFKVQSIVSSTPQPLQHSKFFAVGDAVRIEGQQAIAHIIELTDEEATIAIGMIKMTVSLSRLCAVSSAEIRKSQSLQSKKALSGGKSIIEQIHDKRLTFKQDIDLRGMRVSEGVEAVQCFIDDAMQLGISQVRILHGTGTGALKQAIRNYLANVVGVHHFADEHIQLGGAGITVVFLD